MPDYQKELIKFDLNSMRIRAEGDSTRPGLALPDNLEAYLRSLGVLNLEQIEKWEKILLENSKESESSFLSKMFSLLWFDVVRKHVKLTPKRLVWVLTHLDQLAPYIKGETARDILTFLDNIAEEVYKRIK